MHNISLEDLIAKFQKKGGRINRYYLHNNQKSKQSLVYLNGWFSGQNIRAAILKALSPK